MDKYTEALLPLAQGSQTIIAATFDLCDDCSFSDKEYCLHLTNILCGYVDEDTYRLLDECLFETIDEEKVERNTEYRIIFVEDGEWEDVSWHSYYSIAAIYVFRGDAEVPVRLSSDFISFSVFPDFYDKADEILTKLEGKESVA